MYRYSVLFLIPCIAWGMSQNNLQDLDSLIEELHNDTEMIQLPQTHTETSAIPDEETDTSATREHTSNAFHANTHHDTPANMSEIERQLAHLPDASFHAREIQAHQHRPAYDLDNVIEYIVQNWESSNPQDAIKTLRNALMICMSPQDLAHRVSDVQIPRLLYIVRLNKMFNGMTRFAQVTRKRILIDNVIKFAHARNSLRKAQAGVNEPYQESLVVWLNSPRMHQKSYAIQQLIQHLRYGELQEIDQEHDIGTKAINTILNPGKISVETIFFMLRAGVTISNSHKQYPKQLALEKLISSMHQSSHGWNVVGYLLAIPRLRIPREITHLAQHNTPIYIAASHMPASINTYYDTRIRYEDLPRHKRVTIQYNLMLLGLLFPAYYRLSQEALAHFDAHSVSIMKEYAVRAAYYIRNYPAWGEAHYNLYLNEAQKTLPTPPTWLFR